MCWVGKACDYAWIDKLTAKLDSSGITNYLGVIQAFSDEGVTGNFFCSTSGCGNPRWPTNTEIHEEFNHWRASKMAGYLVFAWHWPDGAAYSAAWLENHPGQQDQLKIENQIGP